jgi:hypothetical protein
MTYDLEQREYFGACLVGLSEGLRLLLWRSRTKQRASLEEPSIELEPFCARVKKLRFKASHGSAWRPWKQICWCPRPLARLSRGDAGAVFHWRVRMAARAPELPRQSSSVGERRCGRGRVRCWDGEQQTGSAVWEMASAGEPWCGGGLCNRSMRRQRQVRLVRAHWSCGYDRKRIGWAVPLPKWWNSPSIFK